MPENVLLEISHSLSWWLRAQSKIFEGQEELFFLLTRRLLAVEDEDVDDTNDLVSRAINHPVGHATEALLNWWYRQGPKDSQGIKDEVRVLFTQLCDTSFRNYRHGRVLLATHSISLFRVDQEWARTYLLPLFNWKSTEARAVWEGFLQMPRLYGPLLRVVKDQLLETALHYGELGNYAKRYADFMTFAALDPGDIFTTKELASVTQNLPAEGLQSAAQALVRALEGAGEQREEYWLNRVLPYLKSIWPKSRNVKTPAISERLGRLCVAAREAFPDALKTLRYWLQPIERATYLIHLLNDAKLCQKFPSEALAFLNEIIGENPQWLPEELMQCLEDIGNAEESLLTDRRFVKLKDFCVRQGVH
jgi:hypothetical protein